jgi:hypothetical protein
MKELEVNGQSKPLLLGEFKPIGAAAQLAVAEFARRLENNRAHADAVLQSGDLE